MSTRSPPRVIVHIDRVALRGYSPLEREAIVAGLRAQLTMRFTAEAHALQSGGDRDVGALRGNSTSGASPADSLGAGVANSVMSWIRT
jgi:hypothetical protein